jgi:hypothetical protein
MSMKIKFVVLFFLLATRGYSQDPQWSKFEWINYSVADMTFDKAAIVVPLTIRGAARTLWMQLDTGSDGTTVYEIPFRQLHIPAHYSTGDSSAIILSAALGNNSFDSLRLWMSKGYGDTVSEQDPRPIIGTIGLDILQGKVFILDFPHNQFCLVSSVEKIPKELLARANFVNVHNRNNKLFLSIEIADTSSDDFFFDTGSSIFPIQTTLGLWQKFTGLKGNEKNLTRLKVLSWGKEDITLGAPARGPLRIGELTVDHPMVYFDSTGLNDYTKWPFKTDGLIGNQVFYDHYTVIIDLINNRFGILTSD